MMKSVIKGVIRAYQLCISSCLPGSCRYLPSCSEYTYESIDRFGILRGIWLGIKRLLRCHPFAAHGLDPVPATLDLKVKRNTTYGDK